MSFRTASETLRLRRGSSLVYTTNALGNENEIQDLLRHNSIDHGETLLRVKPRLSAEAEKQSTSRRKFRITSTRLCPSGAM